ncbi:GNAT family N-acetyltransferase [Pseudalkalibacillus hwajinpoensis]|uniref:GNAT family N-acetyltransferase n=1 Tax=Guptibacillus hwajinpoensis TaxID=208199 RepID=A0A4U1MG93_9BACL|nr:GNAT family N-acetyltransferase [Pseudalkalibacillus hwajinpoensis]TKD69354.1 GNAT family N-acetyltransferase [Pseudalkalibacillus hwajinpoensis]
MNKKQIVQAIEAIQWDYEEALVPESIHYIQKDDVVMIKNENSTSIYANKVIRFDKSYDEIDEVFAFFEGCPFSWWVRVDSQSSELEAELAKRGMCHLDTYIGLAKELHKKEKEVDSKYIYQEVTTEKGALLHAQVASEIWGYDKKAEQAAFSERMNYVKLPNRRGGYMVVLDELPIAYSNYRYSHDYSVLYLNGSGVIESYRGKGVYREMVARRLNEAIRKGCHLVVTQAKQGTSEPILKKVGFIEYATYKQFVTNHKG